MRTADYDFDLPPELIAQTPAARRDESRLLVLHRSTGEVQHLVFRDIVGLLRAGDVLVLNDSRVIPARLRGHNAQTGGQFEILLLEEVADNDWWVMLRPGRRARVGTRIVLRAPQGKPAPAVEAMVMETNAEGHRRLQFETAVNLHQLLPSLGETPLPPYIERPEGALAADVERYQTVYARHPGSVAAPTAGLHFTPALLEQVQKAGVKLAFVTLHVGLGTFAPIKAERIDAHRMHEERFSLGEAAAATIQAVRAAGGRIVAAGTTTVRVLETVAKAHHGQIVPASGRTRIFIHPPCPFHAVDALVTNFHLPRSTLVMLVSAFASPGGMGGREQVLAAYREAVQARYRFFSYGDAMLIL